ncbi:MAG: ribonuclease Y [Armatimonadetes bacterium]|nr:ribonuclease Y [Armatimonadota bacterium]
MSSLETALLSLQVLTIVVLIVVWITGRQGRERALTAIQEAERLRAELSAERDRYEREKETLKREALLEAKEKAHKQLEDSEREAAEKRSEILRLEQKILHQEEQLDKKLESLEVREQTAKSLEDDLSKKLAEVERQQARHLAELERVSGLTVEQARQEFLKRIEDDACHEASRLARQIEDAAREKAESKSREIILDTIQRCTVEHVSQNTVSVVHLPNDDMKGRIIGREGRNVRHFEQTAGVDVIIDDTPEAVVISCFDPIRREMARIALTNLVVDGRIHPTRIEEEHERAKSEVERRILTAGEDAAFKLGLTGLHPEVVRVMGRLKYRTSYAQNVLDHSVEVATLATTLAGELGANTALVKRSAFLHDIGKALDQEAEGPHAIIGADFIRRHGENEAVCNAVAAHHYEVEPRSLEAHIVIAADSISAARPGARRESLESYIKRLEKLEHIADSFNGVDKAYAIQAGREIRVLVRPDRISDDEAHSLCKEIAKKIEEELEYPGQIRVTVIRELRAHEVAK